MRQSGVLSPSGERAAALQMTFSSAPIDKGGSLSRIVHFLPSSNPQFSSKKVHGLPDLHSLSNPATVKK